MNKNNLILFFGIMLISCGIEEESYTLKGRFLNGTSNIPYSNVKVEITKVVGPSGFSKSTSLGEVYTDDNGDFSINYRIRANESGTLHLVFGRNGLSDMLTKSGINLATNNNINFYLSDSCRTLIRFQTYSPLKEEEILKVYSFNEAFDTLFFTKSDLINSSFDYTLRTKKMFGALGVERVNPDTTISIFNPTFEMQGDPILNILNIIY